MGLIIYSNDAEGIEIWQSSYTTYGKFLDEVGSALLDKYNIKPDRYVKMEEEYQEIQEALEEYPKMKSIIEKSMRQLEIDMKTTYTTSDIYETLRGLITNEDNIDENVKKAIDALFFKDAAKIKRFKKKYEDDDDDDDEKTIVTECQFWTTEECKLIYDILKDIKVDNDWYMDRLLRGLLYCYNKGVGAYFC